jgi:hypothetical protein
MPCEKLGCLVLTGPRLLTRLPRRSVLGNPYTAGRVLFVRTETRHQPREVAPRRAASGKAGERVTAAREGKAILVPVGSRSKSSALPSPGLGIHGLPRRGILGNSEEMRAKKRYCQP